MTKVQWYPVCGVCGAFESMNCEPHYGASYCEECYTVEGKTVYITEFIDGIVVDEDGNLYKDEDGLGEIIGSALD